MLYYLDTNIVIYAVQAGCDVFLTNDNQLASFPDITVEVLP